LLAVRVQVIRKGASGKKSILPTGVVLAPKNHDFLFKFIFSMQCLALKFFSMYPSFYQNCRIIMEVDVKVSTRVALSLLKKNIKCTFSNDLDPVIVHGFFCVISGSS